MTGFVNKCVHLSHDADEAVTFTMDVDFNGDGDWHPLTDVEVPARGYRPFCFEPGFSAHWIRFSVSKNCTASAQLAYT